MFRDVALKTSLRDQEQDLTIENTTNTAHVINYLIYRHAHRAELIADAKKKKEEEEDARVVHHVRH